MDMHNTRMECLRLALGSSMDRGPLTEAQAETAVKVAEAFCAFACQGVAEEKPDADAGGQPVTIEGVMTPAPSAGEYMGM